MQYKKPHLGSQVPGYEAEEKADRLGAFGKGAKLLIYLVEVVNM